MQMSLSLSEQFVINISFGQTKYQPHVRGDQGVLFQFSEFTANSYKGGFGCKRYINDKTAVRTALNFNSTKENIMGIQG